MVSLQDCSFNKRKSRGAFGEVQLADIVQTIMAPSNYEFRHAPAGKRVDCLLKLPNPAGTDRHRSEVPLESTRAPSATPRTTPCWSAPAVISPPPSARYDPRHRREVHRPRRDRGIGADVPALGIGLCRAHANFPEPGRGASRGAGLDRLA